MENDTSQGAARARRHVVVVGGGFGGLQVVEHLKGVGVAITLVDQRNYHLFQPLLYQVATASLTASEIAWPIRAMVHNRPDVSTVLGTAVGVDMNGRRLLLGDGSAISYDILVLATGARHGYFGHDDWEPFAPGLKTIEDATRMRSQILLAFEQAERESDLDRRAALLTFVVIGAGPTGVELAGTIADLARDTLPPDFRAIDTHMARVVLIEAGPQVLPGYAEDLSSYARRALEQLGVEVVLGHAVTEVTAGGVKFGDQHITASTIIWAAGVRASPAALWLGVPADGNGRILVEPDLSIPGHPEIFAVGDTISVAALDGKPVPGIAPAAKQGGRYVASVIRSRLDDKSAPAPFRYHHDGSLAQIGKRRAVADFGWIKLRGPTAWWLWGIAHIYFLVGVRARLGVALNWLWIHFRNQRSARLITHSPLQLDKMGSDHANE
ncbi:NADH dehydrogenase [Sphingomonas sp. UYAg733]